MADLTMSIYRLTDLILSICNSADMLLTIYKLTVLSPEHILSTDLILSVYRVLQVALAAAGLLPGRGGSHARGVTGLVR